MISRFDIERRYLEIKEQAEKSGYHLNPDEDFAKDLVHGILVNEERYGYGGCPCRLCIGSREENLDIICPCDYRDPDLIDYGICYCALYVSKDVAAGAKPVACIPDRRSSSVKDDSEINVALNAQILKNNVNLPFPVFRCGVCGYLCARKNPPEVCPICGASSDRFKKYLE